MTSDNASGDEFEPTYVEPSAVERAHCATVSLLTQAFEQAASGQHTGWCLDRALALLLSRYRGSGEQQLSDGERDCLLLSLGLLFGKAPSFLPAHFLLSEIEEGITAAAGLVMFWAEDADQRSERNPHVVKRSEIVARKLRNLAQNVKLDEDLAQTAELHRPCGELLADEPLFDPALWEVA